MKRAMMIFVALGSVLILSSGIGRSFAGEAKSGEAMFKEHCAACHPDGGNIINPRKTLNNKDMTASKVASEEGIINLMRNPGPGMLRFDPKTLSDKDARAIAKYILKTFSK